MKNETRRTEHNHVKETICEALKWPTGLSG